MGVQLNGAATTIAPTATFVPTVGAAGLIVKCVAFMLSVVVRNAVPCIAMTCVIGPRVTGCTRFDTAWHSSPVRSPFALAFAIRLSPPLSLFRAAPRRNRKCAGVWRLTAQRLLDGERDRHPSGTYPVIGRNMPSQSCGCKATVALTYKVSVTQLCCAPAALVVIKGRAWWPSALHITRGRSTLLCRCLSRHMCFCGRRLLGFPRSPRLCGCCYCGSLTPLSRCPRCICSPRRGRCSCVRSTGL